MNLIEGDVQHLEGDEGGDYGGDDSDGIVGKVELAQASKILQLRRPFRQLAVAEVQLGQVGQHADAHIPLIELLQQFQITRLDRNDFETVERHIQNTQSTYFDEYVKLFLILFQAFYTNEACRSDRAEYPNYCDQHAAL